MSSGESAGSFTTLVVDLPSKWSLSMKQRPLVSESPPIRSPERRIDLHFCRRAPPRGRAASRAVGPVKTFRAEKLAHMRERSLTFEDRDALETDPGPGSCTFRSANLYRPYVFFCEYLRDLHTSAKKRGKNSPRALAFKNPGFTRSLPERALESARERRFSVSSCQCHYRHTGPAAVFCPRRHRPFFLTTALARERVR